MIVDGGFKDDGEGVEGSDEDGDVDSVGGDKVELLISAVYGFCLLKNKTFGHW